MTALSLKQFVPSEVCLKCDGCCRYKEANSAWRPKLGVDDQKSLAALITAGDVLDAQGYVKTIQACGKHFCKFLKRKDNTCGIYTKRPFECSLYPFIISQTPDAVKICAHLSCPYVQDHLPRAVLIPDIRRSSDFAAYVAYLKEFFSRAQTKEFLSRNKAMFHDYSSYAPELLHVFDVSFDDALLDKKPLVDSFLNSGTRPLSSFSFVSVFAWCDFFDFELKMINGCLCIFAHGPLGCFLYLPPLGKKMDSSTIEFAFDHMAQGKSLSGVKRIENIPGNLLSAFDKSSYNQYSKNAEYVYRKEDLIALKGNAYKSQRHDCNAFIARQGTHSFGPYMDDDFDSCLGLYERWADNRARMSRDDVYLSMLQENRLVHARLLKFWKPLGVIARVLKSDGEIIGYTFGFALDESTFCIYAEIADLMIPGAAAYMFKSFCADRELTDFSRINTMDDFAMPNVALAKQAYHPSELIASYSISVKKEEHQ